MPPHVLQHPRGPAYQRRQVKREAARAASGQDLFSTEEVVDSSTSNNDNDTTPAAKASDENDKNAAEQALLINENIVKTAEKAVQDFSCTICDFHSSWKNGLQVHMARMHARIEQLDGNSDVIEEDEKYKETLNYWKTGRLSTSYQSFLDVNEIIEASDLAKSEKSFENGKVLEARKHAFGN